jgi:hypothetical protein
MASRIARHSSYAAFARAAALFALPILCTGAAAAETQTVPDRASAATQSPAPRSAMAVLPADIRDMFRPEENGWAVDLEAFGTSQPDRNNITIVTLEAVRAWRFSNSLELQLRGGLLQSMGERSRSDVALNGLASGDSRATGLIAGAGARVYPFALGAAHPFLEALVQVLYTPAAVFPAGGTGINGFERAGIGLSFMPSSRFDIEAVTHFAHVSNGSGTTPRNPMWNGFGGGVTVRYRFSP